MQRSRMDIEPNEFVLIKDDAHIKKVYSLIETNFTRYFDSFLEEAQRYSAVDRLAEKFGKTKTNKNKGAGLSAMFDEAIEDYEKQCQKYRDFFNKKAMKEYISLDPKVFKTALSKDCPIIQRSLNTKSEVMVDWQAAFRRCPGEELLDVMNNIVKFAEKYKKKYDNDKYSKYDHWKDFSFEIFEEEGYGIGGVIGGGIKATILYYLHPDIFPSREIFPLYFLTDTNHFNLPSRTSEFIMLNDHVYQKKDKNLAVAHNYWYPYDLSTFYDLRLYRLMKKKCEDLNLVLDDGYRYVYMDRYYRHINKLHEEDIQTLTGSNEVLRGL